ncbi:aldo/keto reductase [Halobacillus sp. Cin3]|uniref:aldo/keto reductase n=1 Tax=Halobacillus sp. Cin3 TaxID=2928441 RepID=UPI00248D45AA|nr:aldo/keto reductase [Halobacillus sp. Cin3]
MSGAAVIWIMQQDEVTSVIPGFRNQKQVEDNLAAVDGEPYSEEELDRLRISEGSIRS